MEADVKRIETAKIDRDCGPFATLWDKTKLPTYDTFSTGKSIAKVGENRGGVCATSEATCWNVLI